MKFYSLILKIYSFFLREFSCFILKKTYHLNPHALKYVVKCFPFINIEKELITNLENAICLSKLSVFSQQLYCPIKSLCVSNPSCFNVKENIYVVYTIHNHKTSASRRFNYTDNLGSSRIGFGMSLITSDGQQLDLGTANIEEKQNYSILCDFRCLALSSAVLISCSISTVDNTHRIGWCLVPFDQLTHGPSKWIFCIENSPFDYQTEKNWMPISTGDDKFKFVYRPEGHHLDSMIEKKEINPKNLLIFPNSQNFTKKAGGSPFLKFDGKFLACIHQTYLKPYRNYVHFFTLGNWLSIDKFETFINKSSFFFFEPFDSEFCGGMCEIDDFIIFSVGFRNSEGWLLKIKSSDIKDLLE